MNGTLRSLTRFSYAIKCVSIFKLCLFRFLHISLSVDFFTTKKICNISTIFQNNKSFLYISALHLIWTVGSSCEMWFCLRIFCYFFLLLWKVFQNNRKYLQNCNYMRILNDIPMILYSRLTNKREMHCIMMSYNKKLCKWSSSNTISVIEHSI